MLPNSNQQMAINLARLRQQDDQERERRREEQAREAARIAAEAAANTPEALFAQRTAEINEAIAKQQAIERANFDAQARAKAEREAELDRLAIGIGDRISDRQMPVLTEILDVLKQLRDSQAAAHQEEV
jgi:hypothetical protein